MYSPEQFQMSNDQQMDWVQGFDPAPQEAGAGPQQQPQPQYHEGGAPSGRITTTPGPDYYRYYMAETFLERIDDREHAKGLFGLLSEAKRIGAVYEEDEVLGKVTQGYFRKLNPGIFAQHPTDDSMTQLLFVRQPEGTPQCRRMAVVGRGKGSVACQEGKRKCDCAKGQYIEFILPKQVQDHSMRIKQVVCPRLATNGYWLFIAKKVTFRRSPRKPAVSDNGATGPYPPPSTPPRWSSDPNGNSTPLSPPTPPTHDSLSSVLNMTPTPSQHVGCDLEVHDYPSFDSDTDADMGLYDLSSE